jgi:hypothetical protein
VKFLIEDQYPKKWVSGNEPEAPFLECVREPWIGRDDGVDWSLEVSSIEELLSLGKRKNQNLFIRLGDIPSIVLTSNDEPD